MRLSYWKFGKERDIQAHCKHPKSEKKRKKTMTNATCISVGFFQLTIFTTIFTATHYFLEKYNNQFQTLKKSESCLLQVHTDNFISYLFLQQIILLQQHQKNLGMEWLDETHGRKSLEAVQDRFGTPLEGTYLCCGSRMSSLTTVQREWKKLGCTGLFTIISFLSCNSLV